MDHDMLDIREFRFNFVVNLFRDCMGFPQGFVFIHGHFQIDLNLASEHAGTQGIQPDHFFTVKDIHG